MGTTLRLVDRAEDTGHVVDLALEGSGARRTATVQVGFELSARDREDVRWYLEDYLQYPVNPAPQIAQGIEARLAELGTDLFRQVFEANRDTMRLWDTAAGSLADARVEVATGVEGAARIPWELMRDPANDGVLAVRAGAFVRALAHSAVPVKEPTAPKKLRVLLVICRPGGRKDVPFRSVASHLVRLSREARQVFELDVLRPPTYAKLTQVLQAAKKAGSPYHVVHFDGHGAWLDDDTVATGSVGGLDQQRYSVLSPVRPGSHGYLVFENPSVMENQQLVDGPALGQLLVDTNVPVLVLNACRSAHAGLATEPEPDAGTALDAHGRVRAYGSLAQEVMDAGVAGVVAMSYNLYVVTAAKFIGQVYAALLEGQPLGAAVTGARRQLAAEPLRQVGLEPRPLQDWLVPVVYEAAPVVLRAVSEAQPGVAIELDQAEAGAERMSLEPGLPGGPDVGFFGRDETLLALDRAFDNVQAVLLYAWAGAGKTATALEFARWYALTGGVQRVLFTSFEHHLTLARLLDQIGTQFGPALEGSGVQWATLDDVKRRDVALQVLTQIPVLWIWDNVEPVTGFPADAPSAWTSAEQDELLAFLRDLAAQTRCKVLLTSRRDEQAWLGDLPARVTLPPMPMLERLELAQEIARRQTGGTRAFLAVEDWRPLLEFTQGNPLTVTILARQAFRSQCTTRQQIEAFVAQLRTGAAQITDDAAQGRDTSLAASLNYGFTKAFTNAERAQLALLALFQGFTTVEDLCWMGDPKVVSEPVPEVAGLDRDAGIALLDRAAEVGLLTAHYSGMYAVHPAVPWHLRELFEHHYGPPEHTQASQAIRAWTTAISHAGDIYHHEYQNGHAEILILLAAEEDNLLRARQLSHEHGWWDLALGAMQGLRILYPQTGRAIEWRRLVNELIPDFTDPATGGPLPGREDDWTIFTSYRSNIAREMRDWASAEQLQQAIIAWQNQHAAAVLSAPQRTLDKNQRDLILAIGFEDLGHILREQGKPDCIQPYQQAMQVYRRIGDRRAEGIVAFNLGHAYKDIPGLRDLDMAEHWYKHDLRLLDDHDTLGRAKVLTGLGTIARQRYIEALNAGKRSDRLARYLKRAERNYLKALELLPPGAVTDLAVIHQQLGNIYGDAGSTDRALLHYQQSIQLRERQGNRYAAGVVRYNAAAALYKGGRLQDAMLYARAALRDYKAVGAGASAEVDLVRQLMRLIGNMNTILGELGANM